MIQALMKNQQTDLFPDQDQPQPITALGRVQIGTSGYVFKDWSGVFYPSGLPQSRWLEYYARHFTTVEINATHYRLLPASSFEGMIRKTPMGFMFWVKVPAALTHSSADPAEVVDKFLDSISPLIENNRLGGILAQFPFSFKNNVRNNDRIALIKRYFQHVPLAVEFRSDDWYRPETFQMLSDQNLVFTTVDLPEIQGLPDRTMMVTGSVGYLRLHGRNCTTWYHPEEGDRYDYDYSEEELRSWIKKISLMGEKAPISYLFFNNCHAGQAVKNARLMQKILAQDFSF